MARRAKPPPDPRWEVPPIFTLHPELLRTPPTMAKLPTGVTCLRWTDDGRPPLVVAVFMTQGSITWDYTIREPDLGFWRHHVGSTGDPAQDPWTDLDPGATA